MFGQPAGGSEKTNKKAAPKKKPEAKQAKKRRVVVREAVGAVENGVPIPKVEKRGKYPLEELQPGESFLVQGPAKSLKKIRANIMGAARRVSKKTERTFMVVARPEEKGVRCWRTDSVDEKPKKKAPAKKRAAVKKAPEKQKADKPIELTDEVEINTPAPVETPQSFKLDI